MATAHADVVRLIVPMRATARGTRKTAGRTIAVLLDVAVRLIGGRHGRFQSCGCTGCPSRSPTWSGRVLREDLADGVVIVPHGPPADLRLVATGTVLLLVGRRLFRPARRACCGHGWVC